MDKMQETYVQSRSTNQGKQVRKRKRYEKPQIVYQASLEAMAALCITAPGKATVPSPCSTLFS